MEFNAGELSFEDVAFKVGQKLRRVFKLTQNKKGDVYVRIISGVRRGESSAGSPIREDRISLHVSNTSPEYNAFKTTFSATDGSEAITMQLNTAIKSQKGFAHLASVMFSDLAAEKYDLGPSRKEKVLVLGDFDPNQNTAFCALFVSALGVSFNSGKVPVEISKINTAFFQIIIVCGLVSIPAITYARTFSFGTLRPDEPFLGRRERARRLQNMQAKTSDECLKTFFKQVPELLDYRNSYLRVSLEEVLCELWKLLHGASIEEIPSIEASILEVGNLLNEMKPPTQYLYLKNGLNSVFYVDEQGKNIPL